MTRLATSRLLALALLMSSSAGCERKVRGAANQDDIETPMPAPRPLRAGVSWQRVYAGAAGLLDYSWVVTTDTVGNVLVGGAEGVRKRPRPWRQDDEGFVVKLDQDGKVLWRRRLDVGHRAAWVQDLATDDVGNVYAASFCCEVRKFSPGGRVLWTHTLEQTPSSLAAIRGGGVYVCTRANSRGGGKLERLDAEGEVVWTRSVFPGLAQPTCAAVTMTEDDAVLVAANSTSGDGGEPVVIRLAPDNTVQWQVQLEGTVYPMYGQLVKDVLVLPDGRIIAATEDLLGTGNSTSVLAFARDGALLWKRPLESRLAKGDRTPALAASHDGALLVLGDGELFQISREGEILRRTAFREHSVRAFTSDQVGNLIAVGDTERDVVITKHASADTLLVPSSAPR